MKTWSGNDAPLLNGLRGNVVLTDLVVHLGRTMRFGGWGSTEWTVLHHSALVSLLWLRAGFPPAEMHHALLHDAHEAYLGDVPAPVKQLLRDYQNGGNTLKEMEQDFDARIFASLGVSAPSPSTRELIKVVDLAALVIESALFGTPDCHHAVREIDVASWPAELQAAVMRVVGLVSEGGAP